MGQLNMAATVTALANPALPIGVNNVRTPHAQTIAESLMRVRASVWPTCLHRFGIDTEQQGQ